MREGEVKARKFARTLRIRMTNAELLLWSRVRKKQICGAQFRRQYPVGLYVADFACVEHKLIVEIDGATHSSEAELGRDQIRDQLFAANGWRILRVGNRDVYDSLDSVLEAIALALSK